MLERLYTSDKFAVVNQHSTLFTHSFVYKVHCKKNVSYKIKMFIQIRCPKIRLALLYKVKVVCGHLRVHFMF